MNSIIISFANGGYVMRTNVDGDDKVEVFVSTGKLMKAVRGAIDELSLLPKKNDDTSEA
jgi:hypothetical protein